MENHKLGCGSLNVGKSNTCRLCMKIHEFCLNIFVSNEEFKMPIGKAIQNLLVLEVAKDDNLPEIVCCPCVTKLMEFREFKEMCMNSAREFRRHEPVEPITCPAKDEFLPIQLLGEATSETWSNCVDGESRVPVAPNDLSLDPFALENQSDTKEGYPRDPLGESDDPGEEDFAETYCNENEAVYIESKQLLTDEQGEVKKELELTDLVGNGENQGNEIIDEGDTCDPILLSDILAVMDMVDRCNIVGGIKEEPETASDKFGADRQGISQNEVLIDPSYDPVSEENLQLEYSMASSFVVDCFYERMVKKQKKNIKILASSNKFTLVNDRAKPVRNHEREQLCRQDENATYPTEYVCNYCGTRFSQKKSLALHIKRHLDGMGSASVLPKKDFQPRFSQRLLLKDRGKIQPVILETSNTSFAEKSSTRENKKPAGENVGREPYHKRTLLLHSVKRQEKAVFVCDTCGLAFLRKSDLVKHVNVHIGLNPFQCRFCGEELLSKDIFNEQQAMNTGVRQLKCNRCGKECSAYSYQLKRVVTHTKFMSLKCNLCGKNLKNTKSLKQHSVIHTRVKPFKCNQCGKVFNHRDNLRVHSRIHSGVKPFKCNECGKRFTTSSTLNMHSVVHTGVKRFKCNECGKMFTRKGTLNKHSVVHSGVKQFQCNECGKMFSGKGALNMHLVLHTGVKAFKCNECGKMFTRKDTLNMHSRIHSGVKPFKCNKCGKMFTQRGHLRSHSRIHSGVKPFQCDVCGKRFKWKSVLNSHLLGHADQNRSK